MLAGATGFLLKQVRGPALVSAVHTVATGGTLREAIKFLYRRGAEQITCVCLLAAPEGLAALEEELGDSEVNIVLAARDERLDENAYIVPGLGDAGDRLYGVVD